MTPDAAPTVPATGWRARPDVHTAFLPPDAVLFDEATGEVHRLNGGAASVWLVLDGQPASTEIARELGEIYEVPGDALLPDVESAIADFHARGLLDGFPPPPAAPDRQSVARPSIMRPPPDP